MHPSAEITFSRNRDAGVLRSKRKFEDIRKYVNQQPVRIVSVNVGLPQAVPWKGTFVETSIFKKPVPGAIEIKKLNLVGDRQADLTVHGGPNKAVYAYPSEHYREWKNELGLFDLDPGAFGENLTTEGLLEDQTYIGDELQVGTATLQVVQPRLPCYKLTVKFGRDDMIKRFLKNRKPGIYFSVLREGAVEAGSKIELLRRDHRQVSIVDVFDQVFGRGTPEKFEQMQQSEVLPEELKQWLAERAVGTGHI
jgi:MOSC domain-containing protein YiiM